MEDLVLNGTGKTGGGVFDQVVINGAGTVESNIECTRLECNGAGRLKGDVLTEVAVLRGSTSIKGDLYAKNVTVDGHGAVSGGVVCKHLQCNGAMTVGNSIKAEHIQINGCAKAGGNVDGELVEVNGAIQLDGLLNAEKIEIRLEGKSHAKEIGGESLTVKRKKGLSLLEKLKLGFSKTLTVELIEADHIHLEFTKAAIVRGKNVTLGPGCDIRLVEYSEDFHPHKDSVVKESRRID